MVGSTMQHALTLSHIMSSLFGRSGCGEKEAPPPERTS